MILGIGIDTVEIERMEKACKEDAFLTRIFTSEECRQAKGSPSRLAGNFAVKEAVAKVFGTGFRTFMPIHIEVLRDELGKPCVKLHEGAAELAKQRGIQRIHVSITNTSECSTAIAIGESAEESQ